MSQETNKEIGIKEAVGKHFLAFAMDFFKHSKEHFQPENRIKANTLAFQALIALEQRRENAPTMSELAAEMSITKQQLTKIVNDLEDEHLVQRTHDKKNRRLVYLNITGDGLLCLEQLKSCILESIIGRLAPFTPEELKELDQCMLTLSGLMKKLYR